jgi:F-type H+-transporting ATPase subunit delta
MSELIVAHRYAKSLLDFAIEKNVVDAVYTDMVGFKETCEGSKDLVLALKSPIIKHYTKLAILNKLFKSIFNPVTYSIFVIITNKNRESILPAIAKQFINLYSEHKGIQKAEITSASPLTDDQKKSVTKIVKDYTGKEVQLTEHIDESLIGGFILRVGDQQIDDSIRRKLNDLKVTMAS